jgi:hypothetical protein
MNVVHNFLIMLRIADIPVPILPHPELLRFGYVEVEPLVLTQYPASCEGLPSLNKDREVHPRFDENMHVVWHDTPSVKMVALTMEMKK